MQVDSIIFLASSHLNNTPNSPVQLGRFSHASTLNLRQQTQRVPQRRHQSPVLWRESTRISSLGFIGLRVHDPGFSVCCMRLRVGGCPDKGPFFRIPK